MAPSFFAYQGFRTSKETEYILFREVGKLETPRVKLSCLTKEGKPLLALVIGSVEKLKVREIAGTTSIDKTVNSRYSGQIQDVVLCAE